jgi:His/Glu/Gln/Arg/opine family amino acid ABC transporter permease subunit
MRLKYRKWTVPLLLLFMAAALITPALRTQADSSTDNDDNTFIVGFDAEFPPYGYKDENGEYVGFDLSLAQEVCERNGWTLIKQPIDWNSKDMELNSGSIDCIWNGFTMDGREDEYTWSSAYIDNSQVVAVRSDSSINSLDDLAGKTVIVQQDSSALAAFTGDDATEENKALAASFAELQQVSDYNSAFMNLESGVADAVCLDIGVANYQLANSGGKFRLLSEQVSSEHYGIGFKKGNTELRDKVQATLNEMLSDGTFAEIAEEWGLSDAVCLGEEGADAVMRSETSGSSSGFTFADFLDIMGQLLQGFGATLTIFFLTLIFSLPLGLLVTFMRMSRHAVPHWIARVFISILRGTPLMLQLLVVFFGPYYVFRISLSNAWRFWAVIIGFSINYAAYFAEIFRAGIEGVPRGQREAAQVLGYTKRQTFTRIIFPQMVRRVMPPVTNEVITLVKDTSLAFALAYTEMFTLAKQIAATRSNILPLFAAGLFYYIFNFLVEFVMGRIEKKLNYFE